jgi:hypothetical protein
MKRYLVSYFVIAYLINTVFVYTFTALLGEADSVNFFRFLSSSVPYVLPFTVINFVVTGIASCYFIKIILEKRKLVAVLALLVVLLIDLLIFVQSFNNNDQLIIAIRVAFVLASYLALFLVINFSRHRALK